MVLAFGGRGMRLLLFRAYAHNLSQFSRLPQSETIKSGLTSPLFRGKSGRVRATLRKYVACLNADGKAYAYKVSEIEALSGTLGRSSASPWPSATMSVKILPDGVRIINNASGRLAS
jgi:hypothetical protein